MRPRSLENFVDNVILEYQIMMKNCFKNVEVLKIT